MKMFVLIALSLWLSFAQAKWAPDPRSNATEIELSKVGLLEQMQSLLRQVRYDMLTRIDEVVSKCPFLQGSPFVISLLKEVGQVGIRNLDPEAPVMLSFKIGLTADLCKDLKNPVGNFLPR